MAKKKPARRLAKRTITKSAKKVASKQIEKISATTIARFVCTHCGAQHTSAADLAVHVSTTKCGEHLAACHGKDFIEAVEVSQPSTAQAAARCEAVVVKSGESRIAIELRRTSDIVTYIPYQIGGLAVERAAPSTFSRIYKPLADYPTGRAATLFLGFSQTVGATQEAMIEIQKLVDVTEKQIFVASNQLANNKGSKTITKIVKTKQGEIEMTVKSKTRNTAAEMFRGLIMEGKYTDNDIFKKVQEAFSLEDKCRTHVGWYRNQLKRKGQNPPAAIRAPKAPKAAGTEKKTKAAGAAKKTKTKAAGAAKKTKTKAAGAAKKTKTKASAAKKTSKA